MIRVMHFVTDYPGSFSKTPTLAVKNLIDATKDELEHTVVMVDREHGFICQKLSENLYQIGFPRLKFGLLNTTLSFLIFLLFIWRFDVWKRVDVVHCHKLTIDGVFGLFSRFFLKLPYVISIRGASDEKWLRKKFYARWIFRKIVASAEHVFFVSAYMRKVISEFWGEGFDFPSSNLPNISGCDFARGETDFVVSSKILFIGRLSIWRLKGLDRVIGSIAESKDITLDVIGGGEEKYIDQIRTYAESLGVSAQLKFIGQLSNSEVKKRLDQYACLVMPSFPETFGMAFVEALNANLPIIGSHRAGLAGYLDDKPYVACVDEQDVAAIGRAIRSMVDCQQQIKAGLADDYNELRNLFADQPIASHYKAQMSRVTNQ